MFVVLTSLLLPPALAADPTGPVCQGPLVSGMDAPRPVLSGPVETTDVDGGRLRLHRATSGGDVVDDALVAWTETEWLEVMGDVDASAWRGLVGDDGTGGSPAIDAYFVQIDANGYANAITPAEGESGASCFMRFDPDIQDLGETIARSIVRHEIHHCVQFRYTIDAHSWMYESGATLEQYRPAPATSALELLTNILWTTRISEPDRPLDDLGGRFEYAGFVWFKHLEEDGVPPWTVWEALEEQPRWQEGLDGLQGVPLAERAARFHAWNQGACGRTSQTSVGYAADNAGCTAAVEAPRETWEAAPGATVELRDVPSWTARAFEVARPASVEPEAVPRLLCAADAGVLGVALDAPEGELSSGVADGERIADLRLETPAPNGALVVVVSASDEPATATCSVTWEIPEQTGGCGCRTAPSAAWMWLPLLVLGVRRRTVV